MTMPDLYRQILNPLALLQHERTDGALDQVGGQADGEQGDNGKIGKPAQAVGHRHTDYPGKAAVEQEGDKGLTAGTQGKVGGVGVCAWCWLC